MNLMIGGYSYNKLIWTSSQPGALLRSGSKTRGSSR